MNDRHVGHSTRVHALISTLQRHEVTAWLFTAIVVATSAVLIVRTIYLLDRGFDFTDQSFYLMLAQQPAGYELTYGLFAYGLHPLYELVGGSIASMQRAGAMILIVSGAALGFIISNKIKTDWHRPAGAQIVAVSASLPLCYYVLWIPIPGYNWMGMVGGIVLTMAMALLLERGNRFGSAAMAAAGALFAILTRPQTAVGFGALYIAGAFLVEPSHKSSLIQVALAACLAMTAIVGIAAILPLETIVNQIKEYTAIFGMAHPLHFSFINQQLDFAKSTWLWFVSSAIFAFVLFSRLCDGSMSYTRAATIFFVTAIILAVTLLQVILHVTSYKVGSATGILSFCALSFACLRKDADVRLIGLLGIAALLPWTATLGASGAVRPQLAYFSGISTFIAFVGIAVAARRNIFAITVASCAGLYITFSSIQSGLVSPYRLAAPIAKQIVPTRMGLVSELKLDLETNRFVEAVRAIVTSNGFCQGDPAIDLSGAMPGVVFAVGGRMPVFPWIFAGYPFSDYFLQQYLERVGDLTLYRSWLILNEGKNNFSKQQIEFHGVDFNRFRVVGDLRHPVNGSSVQIYAPTFVRGPCGGAG
jgi:hypothetical protein